MNKYQRLLDELAKERDSKTNLRKNSHTLIIDGLNTFIRVFAAVPALNDDGDHIGGVTGFLRSVASVIKQFKPTRCVIVFDGKGGSLRRKKLYPDYKANRAVKTRFNRYEEFDGLVDEQDSMRKQLHRVAEYLQQLPVTVLSIDNVEADDVIAYIGHEILNHEDDKVTIVSTDRDFLQLVNHRINVWSPVKKKLYTPELIREEFEINEHNYLIYRAFDGDKSDNINGVPGLGLKTLRKEFPILKEEREIGIEEIISYTKDVAKDSNKKIYSKILENEDIIKRNYELMQLKDSGMSGDAKLRIQHAFEDDIQRLNQLEFKKMFMRDKMYSIIKNLDYWLNESFATLNTFAK